MPTESNPNSAFLQQLVAAVDSTVTQRVATVMQSSLEVQMNISDRLASVEDTLHKFWCMIEHVRFDHLVDDRGSATENGTSVLDFHINNRLPMSSTFDNRTRRVSVAVDATIPPPLSLGILDHETDLPAFDDHDEGVSFPVDDDYRSLDTTIDCHDSSDNSMTIVPTAISEKGLAYPFSSSAPCNDCVSNAHLNLVDASSRLGSIDSEIELTASADGDDFETECELKLQPGSSQLSIRLSIPAPSSPLHPIAADCFHYGVNPRPIDNGPDSTSSSQGLTPMSPASTHGEQKDGPPSLFQPEISGGVPGDKESPLAEDTVANRASGPAPEDDAAVGTAFILDPKHSCAPLSPPLQPTDFGHLGSLSPLSDLTDLSESELSRTSTPEPAQAPKHPVSARLSRPKTSAIRPDAGGRNKKRKRVSDAARPCKREKLANKPHKKKRAQINWPRPLSSGSTSQRIQCDHCQVWYHFACVHILPDDKRSTEVGTFQCPACIVRVKPGEIKQRKWTLDSFLRGCFFDQLPLTLERGGLAEDEFYFDYLLGRLRIVSGGGVQLRWLVKWSNYPIQEATWEPYEHISDNSDRIDEFFDRASKEGLPFLDDADLILLQEAAAVRGIYLYVFVR
ncbi:hypothetical protein FISHEDRAFT_74701 [Fistulina hepatica ATCC 64428]|uniref:Chromo domain-containing protein n=1 Tax=Fistulina hepatica ATCC 64428 TaxID=1128425 RepID=A0A0D7A8T2_9AGAR|nr:hypothetical protein FISHEDRAFT_74701 [Fistulina hepatica ATCC 64428]